MNTRITALRLSKEEHDRLNQIAEMLGYTYGGKGSITQLLKAVADGNLIISKKIF